MTMDKTKTDNYKFFFLTNILTQVLSIIQNFLFIFDVCPLMNSEFLKVSLLFYYYLIIYIIYFCPFTHDSYDCLPYHLPLP